MKFIWFDKFTFKKNHEGTAGSFRIFKRGGSESGMGEKKYYNRRNHKFGTCGLLAVRRSP